MLANTLEFVSRVKCTLTDDQQLSAADPAWHTPEEVVAYLDASARHAVVIVDLDEVSGECVAQAPQYVLRGASEQLDNFYFGAYPAEDPNDADGGQLTAAEALAAALDGLCS